MNKLEKDRALKEVLARYDVLHGQWWTAARRKDPTAKTLARKLQRLNRRFLELKGVRN